MSQAVLRPNLTKKFQWEVFQIAGKRFSLATLLGGLSVNLNHLKSGIVLLTTGVHIVADTIIMQKFAIRGKDLVTIRV